MFKRILVPLDGSSTSERGLEQAIKLASERRATLYLLHVVDEQVLTQSIDADAATVDSLLGSLRNSGRKILDDARARARKRRLRSTPVLVENMLRSVADVIVEQARKRRADLIVMGTHGRRGIKRVVMGSAAEGVVRATPVPVLLVRSPAGRRR
ncbi:MAG TPA: universal stress protein [Burkholderiales bacterium]|nr:universal stress protein [Burkholderiales bacterium]